MNKKFLSAILFGALMVTSTGTFVSCKDYDDDIEGINKELTEIKSQIAALQTKIDAGKWITNVSSVTGGFTVTFSDGSNYTITNGADGAKGDAGTEWTISDDGFWVCDGEKTSVKAVGQDGAKGEDAQPEVKKENGKWYLWNAETGAFEEISVEASAATGIPYYYTDPNDPNYTVLVINDANGENKKEIRLPMTSGLGQIEVLKDMNLRIVYNTFNGAHFKDGKATDWTEGTKALPAKGEYMLTANTNAVYVQVTPADYDISKLSFKLVNTKGDEAPIVLGTPEPCTEALSRATSESGVYAIPFTLPEMTDAVLKEYKANIQGKALSLVATESVRSTYTCGLTVAQATANTFGECYSSQVADEQPYTVTIEVNASNVYDSFLTMASDAAKADSVRYGIKIDGMTISYNENIPANKTIEFTINQINARAVVNSENTVWVKFNATEAVEAKTIVLDAIEPHKAIALRKNAAGQPLTTTQSVVADFEPYFEAVASTDGERLIWNDDVYDMYVSKVVWTYVNKTTGAVEEKTITDLVSGIVRLDANGADKNGGDVDYKDFSKLRLQFATNYGSEVDDLGNGTLVATIAVRTVDEATNRIVVRENVEVPFSIEAPAATEIASWFNWNAQNNYTADGLVRYVNTGNTTIDLTDDFAYSTDLNDPVVLSMSIKHNATKGEWTPNMTIGYPATVTAGLTTDAAKNTAKGVVTWTNFTNPAWMYDAEAAGDADDYLTTAQIEVKSLAGTGTKYFGTYTISGIKVAALNGREFTAAGLNLVIKGEASRDDVLTFSKDLQIASANGEYIRLSDAAFTPNAGSFFGTFTLKDYMDRNYVLSDNATTTITVYDVAEDGTYTNVSSVVSAKSVEYTYTLGSDADTKAYGIELTYIGSTEYPAGKTFKVMLSISGLTKDGNSVSTAVVVPATITIGGI